jgi:hypothetical protein
VTTLLSVLVGGRVSSRSQQRHWFRDRQAEACARVLRESSNVLIELGAMNGRRVNRPEYALPDMAIEIDWRPWNEALAMVNLLADTPIVEAALAIDTEIWPAHLKVKACVLREGEYLPLRDKIEAKRLAFINVARKHLESAHQPLHRASGRPHDGDPVWELDRSRPPTWSGMIWELPGRPQLPAPCWTIDRDPQGGSRGLG